MTSRTLRAFARRPLGVPILLALLVIAFAAREGRAQTWQISANSRDAWGDGSSGNFDIADFGDTTFADAGGYQWAVTLPRNTTIVSAKLRLYSTLHLGAAGAYTVRIRVEDVDSAAAFTGAPSDILTRSYWSTTVDWNIPAGGLPINTWSESPDIAPLIQHIVNRAGWTSGNYLNIAVWGQTSGGGTREVINDFSSNPALSAQLVLTARPSLDQIHYRWRNDDGNETTATFAAAEDTKLSGVKKNFVERLRFEVSNEGSLSSGPTSFELQVAQSASCSAPTALGKTISAGESSTCVLLASGGILCWGYNGQGQLGDGSTTDRHTAVPVTGITNADKVSIGESHACAGYASGAMDCWGGNSSGQLGDGTTSPHTTPAPVPAITNASQVLASSYTTCAQLDTGGVECWGNNSDGDLGDGTGSDQYSPVSVLGLSDAIQTSEGHYHGCSLRALGNVDCWGRNDEGQIGDNGAPTDRLSPVTVPGLSNIVEIVAGGYHTCARTAADNIYCWGRNSEGQVGDGTFTERHVPVAGPSLSGIVELVAGGYHTCARLTDGTIRCWGRGTEGQLGDGSASDQANPVTVSGISNAVALAAGHYHTCAILATGDIACWGANWFGEIGDNTTTQRDTPVTWTPSSAPALPNAYSTVPTDTSGHWQIKDSSYYADGDPSTDISPGLTNEATTFVTGELKDTGNTTGSITLDADELTELEYSLKATANAVDGSNYCFRLYDATGTQVLDSYSVYAQVEMAGSTNYRSIGTALDYTTGTITATDGSDTVTGAGTSWRAANRGRGDRIGINGTDYTIQWVSSDTELTLTTPVSGNYTGAYTISRQFTTLQAWENCISGAGGCTYFPVVGGNLVSQKRKETGIAYKDSVFTDNLVIDGSTTDATYNITLTVDPGNRHSGIAGSGVVLNPASDALADQHAIAVMAPYTRIEWLEITDWGGNSSEAIHIGADNTSYAYILAHGGAATTNDQNDAFYLGPDGSWTATIRNSIIYDVPRAGIHLQNFMGVESLTLNVENVTVYNCGTVGADFQRGGVTIREIAGSTSVLNAVNVLSVGNTNNDFTSVGTGAPSWGSSDFNVSSDGSAPGASTFAGTAAAELVNVTAGAEDLHLKSGAVSIDKGTDLSAQFSSDIDLQLRPWGAQWDIGADEIPPTGSCSVGQPAWFDLQWSYRKEIAINGTKVAGALTGFPLLINLASDADLAAYAQDPNGDDILFTLSDGVTKLSHEIETFDGTTGALVAWVKVPYLASGADTTIFMYYGNGTAGSQQDVANVWDTNFKGIWHLDENPDDPAPQFPDVTSNTNDGTANSLSVANQVPGQIDGSLTFDSTNERHVNVPDDPSLRLPSDMTVSAWIKTTNSSVFAIVIVNKWLNGGSKNYWLGKYDASNLTFQVHNDTYLANAPLALVNDGFWHHVVGVADATAGEVRIYVDGIERGNDPTYPGTSETGTSPLQIGKSSDVLTQTWDGEIDEVRVSNAARSDAWIQTSFTNQNDPANFYTLCAATTEVELTSFVAVPSNGAVELSWETASELDNLGFHLYRSTTERDHYERITTRAIPGLGSSPVGAKYSYRDEGLTNGVTYYYKLEDIETTGKTTLHGPVWATPRAGNSSTDDEDHDGSDDGEASRRTYGDPSLNSLEVVQRGRSGVTLVLETGGFYATPQDDGSVELEIPGFDVPADPDAPGIPIRRTWVEAVAGRKVQLLSVTAHDVQTFSGLRPSEAEIPEVVAAPDATVRVARRRRSPVAARASFDGLYPLEAASIASVGFQGDVKKALMELAPLRWDPASGHLLLSRRLVVEVSFRGREPDETSTDGVRGRRYRERPQSDALLARLVTTAKGLHRIRYEDVASDRRGVDATDLRLSRRGESVPFHLEPTRARFGPGSTLYFLSAGADANPYGKQAVYELSLGSAGEPMPSNDASPSGHPEPYYSYRLVREQNLLYQAALIDAPDRWLWDLLFAPVVKPYPFEVHGLAPGSEASKLIVYLQGASDFHARPDHHVRVYVNGTFAGESSWDGKRANSIDVELLPGMLREGENILELENVGDTGVPYSMIMLDRFEVVYPRAARAVDGTLEGQWTHSGTAELTGLGAHTVLLDVTETTPRWLTGGELGADGVVRFRTEAGRSYLAVTPDALVRPAVKRVKPSTLSSTSSQAEYLIIAPRAFLAEAQPLLELRMSQGLTTKAVSTEEIYSAFGFGEATPQAIQEFLRYAYLQWQAPSLRYVVLLGDATYDFKDYLGTGVKNRVPPMMVKTTYLWTASDPSYAAVNGDDVLPDIAIGRLPAATVEEARAMVDKIVAYETGDASLEGPTVLIADNPDRAGDFEADAEEIASGLLAPRDPEKIYLRALGPAAARDAIRQAFDDGASLMSYLGHGGIHLWASEDVLDINDVASLSPQAQQPLLLTMNCLNGYYHFPYFDALSEALVKAEGKGAIAAFSPSGLSLNDPAHRYHEALLKELFSGKYERLGDALLAAQVDYAETGALPELLSIYHLLGDPALLLR
jgi:alpha-tubulin suppressor-like RCC1 family protein